MPTDPASANDSGQNLLRELGELRSFAGTPRDFWPRYLSGLLNLTAASKAILLLQDATATGWKKIGDYPPNLEPSRFITTFNTRLSELANACTRASSVIEPIEPAAPRGAGHFAIASRIKLYRSNEICVAVLLLSEVNETTAREALLRLSLAADVPESYQTAQAVQQAAADVQKVAVALDLMVAVNAEKRFVAAALALCNGLASRFNCDRVSLGWLKGGYIKLAAISRTERFNRQMAAAQLLESAMDECLDQDEEIIWPLPTEGANLVARDHEKFSKDQNVPHIASFPLRVDGKAVAVLSCERAASQFTQPEVHQIRLCCDQAIRRLSDLQRTDRWPGARLAAWSKDQVAMLVGPKHTWAKALAVFIAVLLLVLFLVRVPYRVEGNFVVKSDDASYRTAPFDSYIERVLVRPGDVVKSNSLLLQLATRELQLEESAAQADVVRYQRESEKARANNNLAEMRVGLSLAEQGKARLDLVRYRLAESSIKAPFDGVVVEGDLRERLAAPVKQGDALLRIARLDRLYVEAEVPERDIHEILGKQRGEISFVSQPRLKFPVRIVKIEPAAFPKSEGNVFLVRCEFEQGIETWWRPGMSGLCKLSVEPRTLWWILTHRTVDFLRLKLWW